jgi:hypothetical protein
MLKEHNDYSKLKDTFIGEKKRALPSGIIVFLHWKLRRRKKKETSMSCLCEALVSK